MAADDPWLVNQILKWSCSLVALTNHILPKCQIARITRQENGGSIRASKVEEFTISSFHRTVSLWSLFLVVRITNSNPNSRIFSFYFKAKTKFEKFSRSFRSFACFGISTEIPKDSMEAGNAVLKYASMVRRKKIIR